MPSSREVAVPLANYPSGTRQVTARNVPDWATHFAFEFERCTSATPSLWPNASTTLDISFELLIGQTWIFAGGFSCVGGIISDDDGELPLSKGMISLTPGINRQLRATAIITNGPLRTQGTLEFVG